MKTLVASSLAFSLVASSVVPGGSHIERVSSAAASQIAEVEHGLNLKHLMGEHGIAGLSVAVIDGYKIVWAKGYGVTAKGGGDPVTPDTLFMAGSISKPVAAVVALALVDEGKLDLDSDVNERLQAWKIPETSFTSHTKVTLRRILDHTSGITGGDFFPGYGRDTPIPTLVQILAGKEPAQTPPVKVSYAPGSRWEYSGTAYLVAQQLMVDASGLPFPMLARKLVFNRIGMSSSTFEQPLPRKLWARAARGTLINGKAVDGGWHVQPEMAAGGLWTTPSDLAKLAIELALEAHGQSTKVLSARTAASMLEPNWRQDVINILGPKGSPDMMGYGFFVGPGHRFGHIGGNVGYQATLVMFADTGKGAVIMTNSDVGLQAGNALLNKIAAVYGWNYQAPPPP